MSLSEVLKASKTQQFPDYWTLLWGRKLSASMIKTITGTLPLTFTTSETALRSWTLHGAHMRHTIAYPPIMDYPAQIFAGTAGAADTWTIYGNSSGIGERTKNIVDISSFNDIDQNNVVMILNNDNATISVYTTSTPTAQMQGLCNFIVSDTGNYLLSGIPEDAPNSALNSYIWDRDENGRAKAWDKVTDMGNCNKNNQSVEVYLEQGVRYQLRVRVQTSYGKHEEPVIVSPMIRKADTTSDFIPYGYQVPITVSQDEENYKNYEIFIGDTPLTEGQSVSDTQPIEVFEGVSTISTTLTNKPRLDITVFDYYGIASRVNLGYQIKFKVTHNGSTRTIDIPVPNSMDEGDIVTDINPIPTEIGENTISLNWNTYPTTTMTIKYKE